MVGYYATGGGATGRWLGTVGQGIAEPVRYWQPGLCIAVLCLRHASAWVTRDALVEDIWSHLVLDAVVLTDARLHRRSLGQGR